MAFNFGGAALGGMFGGAPGAALGGTSKDPIGKVGKFLGIGQQGEYFQPGELPQISDYGFQALKGGLESATSGQTSGMVSDYASGKTSLADVLRNRGMTADQRNMLATDPFSGSRFAAEQVQSNPLLASTFGKEGMMERAIAEERDLAGKFGKVDENYATQMGQLKGDLTRKSGQEQAKLAQALQARGLGGAQSGAALAAMGGQMGSQAERLASQMMDLQQQNQAQQLARLGQTRQFASGMTGQAGEQLQNQFGRQMSARQQLGSEREAMAGAEQAKNALELQRGLGGQQLAMESLASKKAAKTPTLGEAFGRGLTAGVQGQGAKLPGALVGGATGGGMG